MNTYELIAPCHFGLESVLKREIYDLGYDISSVEDGKVTFVGDSEAICRANINLRTTERILIKVGQFKAETFTELFDNTKALEWENYIPKNGKFWVTKANSVNSKLFSSSDIQSIVKKAIVERLKEHYRIGWFEEDGDSYPIRVTIMKDIVTIALDTSGDSLHKRGYRPAAGKAPISETLAAALIMLTPWRGDRILVDPFCGSGTTMRVCQQLKRNGIGIEINEEYVKLAKERLNRPFEGFDSIDTRMLRVPNDLNDAKTRNEYIKKHIDWFLKNHPDRVTSFLEDVNTKYSNKRESLQMEFVF